MGQKLSVVTSFKKRIKYLDIKKKKNSCLPVDFLFYIAYSYSVFGIDQSQCLILYKAFKKATLLVFKRLKSFHNKLMRTTRKQL